MANTVIQIKRSSSTAIPANGSLSAAELAYSYQSGKLFIGTSDGSGVIAIGGKFFLDNSNTIFDVSNASFATANAGITHANQAYNVANAAFGAANNVAPQIAPAFNHANAAYSHANASYVVTNTVYAITNASYAHANAGYSVTNTVYAVSNAAFAHANAGHTHANLAFDYANSVNTYSQTTYLNQLTGGTVTGDLSITGNLYFSGNATTISSNNLVVGDSMIYLAANNYTGTDLLDIGFVANYGNTTGANVHTGLFRDATNKQYYLFQGLDIEPGDNHIVPYANNMVNAALHADLITSNLSLGGANAIVWIKSAYDNSNANFGITNSAFAHANSVYDVGNAVFAQANANFGTSNAAFAHANAGHTHANLAYNTANAGYAHANAGYAVTNTVYAVSNASFAHANAGHTHANLAYALANSATAQAANADFLTSGTVNSSRISGSYTGITGVGTLTVGTWNADTISVPYGGTGKTSFTTNGILYGNSSGDLRVTSAATLEGQVLQSDSAGVPNFAMLDGGTF